MGRKTIGCFGCVLACLCFMLGCQPVSFVVQVGPDHQPLEKQVLFEKGKSGSRGDIAIVDISGVLVNADRGLLGADENPLSLLHEQLRAAAIDADVRAVVLRINSPGGGVTVSEAMVREIERFQKLTGKPVLAQLMDVAASGGYYVATAADTIVAYPTSVTGSVGVIIQTVSLQPALSSIGIQTDAITSGSNKAAGSPLSTLTDEQRVVLQKMVDQYFELFMQRVRDARPGMDDEAWNAISDGRVVTGIEAKELGLVDQLGDVYDTFVLAMKETGTERGRLVRYVRPTQSARSPYAQSPEIAVTGFSLGNLGLHDERGRELPVGFYYLWQPELP